MNLIDTLKNLNLRLIGKTLPKISLMCLKCNEVFSDTTSNLYKKERSKIIACHYCNGSRIRIKDIEKLIQSKNGKLLNIFPSKSRCIVQCCNEHSPWEISYSNLKRGKWCPSCAGKKISTNDLKRLVIQRGYSLISSKYVTSITKYKLKCQIGHEFSITHNKLQGGGGCPECTKGVSERIVREYFEKCFKANFPNSRDIEWLLGPSGNRLELDGYNKKLGIAFEHQGLQHYGKKNAFNSNDELAFAKILNHDKIKKELCDKHDVKLIEIPQLFLIVKLDCLADLLMFEFLYLEIVPIYYPYEIKIDWTKIYNSQKTTEVKETCRKRNLVLLDEVFMGAKTRLKFKCKKCNYKFTTAPQSLKGCPACAGNLKKNIPEIKQLGIKKGLVLVSNNYKNSKTDLEFRCKICNRSILKSLGALQASESGCRYCYIENMVGRNKISEKVIKKRCESVNLIFISSFTKKNQTFLNYKCLKCGFEDKKSLSGLTSGKGCLRCKNNLISKKRKKPVEALLSEALNSGLKILNPRDYLEKGQKKLNYKCNQCNKLLKMNPTNVRAGQGCKSCKISLFYAKNKKTPSNLVKESKDCGLKILNPEEYIKTSQYLKYQCNCCGKITEKKVSNVAAGNAGCRACSKKR